VSKCSRETQRKKRKREKKTIIKKKLIRIELTSKAVPLHRFPPTFQFQQKDPQFVFAGLGIVFPTVDYTAFDPDMRDEMCL
jgi:hypothetical protein